ncbi:MAG: DUF115 domain-containing protein [Spirochaetes bacterium]|nr:DUF115 domain-containing protein [Spirochaetota bacterium]
MDEERPRLVETAGGVCIFYRGRYLYSRVDAAALPRRMAASTTPAGDTLYFVPSPIACHGLAEFFYRLPPSSSVLCAELDGKLLEFAVGSLPDGLAKERRFGFPRSTEPAAIVASARSLGTFRRVVELKLSGGWSLFPERYAAILEGIGGDIASYWRNRATMGAMASLWIRNTIENLGRCGNFEFMTAPRIGRPVLVCGAGPSLDALPDLPGGSRPFVLAVDTALMPLLARGIVPDAVVCLEAQIHNLGDFQGSGGRPMDLFVDLSAHPATFTRISGRKWLLVSEFESLGFLERIRTLPFVALPVPALGSVGVLAMKIALEVSTGPVFAVGLDFSFRPGMTHARASPPDLAERNRETRTYKRSRQWNSGYGARTFPIGNGFFTDNVLASYAESLKALVSGQGRVFDLRGGGLDLGIPAASWSDCLDASSDGEDDEGTRVDPLAARNAARGFLSDLRKELGALYGFLKTGGTDEALRASLAACEWVFCHFPDAWRAPSLTQDFLNRVLPATLYWDGRIEAALDAGGGCQSPDRSGMGRDA